MVIKRLRNHSGFSFFEILVVMALIGVLAVIAMVRHSFNDPTLMTQTQVLKAHIRYAQTRSMNTDTIWGINYRVAGTQKSYWLYKRPDTEAKIVLPGETKDQVHLDPLGIDISQGSFTLEFNSWGSPSSSLTGTDTLVLTLTKSGVNEQLTVTQNTGFIP
jgi:MSHA pilin protein MshC